MFSTSLLTWRVSRSTQVFSQKSASMTPCISAVLFVTLVAPMWKFSPVLICAGPQASTIGLSPGRGRFVIAVKAPSNTFLSSRHNPGGTARLLTKRATAHVQLCTHCVVGTNVVATFPSDRFPRWFPTFLPDGGGQSPVIP